MNPSPFRGRSRRDQGPVRRRAARFAPPVPESLESRALLAAGPFGINVDISPYASYVNWLQTTGNWGDVPGQSNPIVLNASGDPESDATVLFDLRVNQPFNGPDPNAVTPNLNGTYHLSFNGQAAIQPEYLGFSTPFTIQNLVYTASTNTTTEDLVVPAGNTADFFGITFANTRATPTSGLDTGFSNAKLIRPGYAANSAQIYTNEFVAALAPYSMIRYLNADGANYQPFYNGNTLVTVDAPQVDQTGTPWEYLVALANQTNTDMWINIPQGATDAYVAALAGIIKDGGTVNGVPYPGLNANLKVYVEYSNEVWGGNPNAEYYQEAAVQNSATNTPLSSFPGNLDVYNNPDGTTTTDVYTAAGRRYLERTYNIGQIFQGVLGADPGHQRIRPVLGWQENNYAFYPPALNWFEHFFGPAGAAFYGMGNATYWGPTDYSSVDAAISSLAAQETSYAIPNAVDFTTLATFYGLKNVSYEGGPSISGNSSTTDPIALAASRDPRMEQLVYQHYVNYFANGGGTAAYFDGPFGTWSPGNEWDAAELAQYGNPTASPKYRGTADVAAAAPVAVTAGIPIPSTSPTSFAASVDTLGASFLVPKTGQQGYWLLNAASAGNYDLLLTTNSVGGTAPGQVEVFVNDKLIGGPVNVSASSTVDLGNLPLSAGISTLSVYAVHGIFDPSQANTSYYQFQPVTFTIKPAATPTLRVDNFTPTSTGFTAHFTAPIVPGDLYLYTTAANAAAVGAASVILVDKTSGSTVNGSLVVSADDQTITFIATAGTLPDDSYSVDFRSSTTHGFFNPNAGALDGNGDGTAGDDYTNNFSETTAGLVVSLPNFTRGPKQSIDLPNGSGNNLPLTINNGGNVTSVTLNVGYNPALLTILGAKPGPNAPAGSSVTVDTSTTPGVAVVTFMSATPLPQGKDVFAELLANVPYNAPYLANQALIVSNVNALIQTPGPFNGTTTLNSVATAQVGPVPGGSNQYLNIGGSATGASASFGVVDFNFGGTIGGVMAIGAAKLNLTEANLSTSTPGLVDVYITADTGSSTSGLAYDRSTSTGVPAADFTDMIKVGTFNDTATSGSPNQVATIALTLNAQALTILENDLNTNGRVRLLLAAGTGAGNNAVVAGFSGLNNGIANQPSLAITATSSLSATPTTGTGGPSLQEVAYVGDTLGSQRYSGLGISEIRRYIANIDSGFAAYPTVDPVVVASLSGSTGLTSLDASQYARYVSNLPAPAVPPIPGPAAAASATNSSNIEQVGPQPAGPGSPVPNQDLAYFDIEGDSNGSTADYAVADFNFAGSAVAGITPTSLQISLTEDNSAPTNGGSFQVWVTGQTGVDIKNDGSSPLVYQTGNATGIASNQFTDRQLVGTFNFTQQGQASTDIYTATLTPAAQGLLAADLVSGAVRLLFTPNNAQTPGVAVTAAGSTPAGPSFKAPVLQIDG